MTPPINAAGSAHMFGRAMIDRRTEVNTAPRNVLQLDQPRVLCGASRHNATLKSHIALRFKIQAWYPQATTSTSVSQRSPVISLAHPIPPSSTKTRQSEPIRSAHC